ncbi:MAG: IS630 family transposase [Bryobacterales bacterium]|nr:IS630 family transposase [Bryobacterales bacterium]
MYRDVAQWLDIRHRILVQGAPIRRVARETGIDPETVRKMRDQPLPLPYGPRNHRYPKLGPHVATVRRMLNENATLPPSARFSIKAIYGRICDEGFQGGYSTVRDYIRPTMHDGGQVWEYAYDVLTSLEKKRAIDFLFLLSRADPLVISAVHAERLLHEASRVVSITPETDSRAKAQQLAFEWMRAVLQKDVSPDALARDVGNVPDFAALLHRLYEGRLSDRNRSMAVLANWKGLRPGTVRRFLGIDGATHRKYLRTFKKGGRAALFAPQTKSTRKIDDEAIKQAVFQTLHEPPSNYGINRTTWILSDLSRVLREKGHPASREVIRKITKAAGYRWRKARTVLTSPDPEYTQKLDRIHSILSGLCPDEAFFSIDEFGPFAVKMQPGRALCAPGEQRVVPQWQKSRGCLIATAALELSGNQVTHFYSSKKNTAEMIRMMDVLVERYRDRRKLYLSWDAASWHISKHLNHHIEKHNATVLSGGGPTVKTAPLPSGAQFLNVIESVFSGMARSIIHNSDYKTLDDAKAAIDRYFTDRNEHFLHHPRRAGRKIWGKEREVAAFSEANNCKDSRYR